MTGATLPCTVSCVHCAVSKMLMTRQELLPIKLGDVCLIGQVLADIVGSIPDATVREEWAHIAKLEIGRMLNEAAAGTWHRPEARQ